MRRLSICFIVLFSPIFAFAKTIDNSSEFENMSEEIVGVTEKYYKEVILHNAFNEQTFNIENSIPLSYVEEVSKYEYENYNETTMSIQSNNGYIETTYKKLKLTITKSGNNYVYNAYLEWKNMPSTRSYDIIGVGFNPSVRAIDETFSMNYCLKNGSCYTNNTHYPKIISTGVGASFKVPSNSDLATLNTTLKVIVTKNVSETITKQLAVADYSHAISSVSQSSSLDYTVGVIGIILDGSITDSYDSINAAELQISCNW